MNGKCFVSDRQDMDRGWIYPPFPLVFAKAAVILITCQSRRLPLWNRRGKQDVEHLTFGAPKRCGLHTNTYIIAPIIFFLPCFQTAEQLEKVNIRIWCIAWLGCNPFINKNNNQLVCGC